ncbi:MAG: serine hydrolase [Saprospiraceae bacterium]|nr:serine hydrolase [Saprospiraceae bacterium]
MKQTVVLTLLSLFIFSNTIGQSIVEAQSKLKDQLKNEEIAELLSSHSASFPNNTQLSIALIDGDKIEYIGVIRKNDELHITENKNSIFEIGSISKAFTSIVFSHLVSEGKLSLEDKLSSVLPFEIEKAPKGLEAITLEMLANHTSGLPRVAPNMIPVMMMNQQDPYADYTTILLDEYLKSEITLENEPQTTYSYSNLGAGTLGYISTLKAELSYEELVRDYIFNPLSMESSTSVLSKVDNKMLVKGLNPDGSEATNWDFTDAAVGAGGIKSNAVDMVRFILKNLEEDAAYTRTHASTFTVNPNLQIGLGWHISIDGYNKVHWHNGGTGGYRSCMAFDKQNKKAVLVLSNVSAFGSLSANIDTLCFKLIKNL